MRDSWERRIARAEQLASGDDASVPLMRFYARVLRRQSEIYDAFRKRPPSGDIERDAPVVAELAEKLLRTVAEHGPDALAAEAKTPFDPRLLLDYWRDRSDRNFFGKAILQPYAQCLVEGIDATHTPRRCPRCGGTPQLSILNVSEGIGRQLLCATCLTPWPFPRVVCASCGEDDERKVGYFHTPAFEHVRVDACDTCRRYIKSVDLARLGVAVPLVDEASAATLDVWAGDHGYEKIELNLLGL
jgi:FdhE protein